MEALPSSENSTIVSTDTARALYKGLESGTPKCQGLNIAVTVWRFALGLN
jgi:hypothetical protein